MKKTHLLLSGVLLILAATLPSVVLAKLNSSYYLVLG